MWHNEANIKYVKQGSDCMTVSFDLSFMTFVAIQSALKAADILRRGFGTAYEITAKPGRQNIVTEYDILSEEAIISFIKHHFPTHSFLGEESGLIETQEQDDQVLWLIDPLDGTTNFARHIPLFTISIAAYYQTEGLCSVIYQPFTNELFIAEKNKGAYLNGVRLGASVTSRMDEAVIGAGFPYPINETRENTVNHVNEITKTGAILRNLGSAALMLAYVAAGKLDAFWMDSLYPWDVAAGRLLIEEAGGLITQYNGEKLPITTRSSVIASNRIIHDEMLMYLQRSS